MQTLTLAMYGGSPVRLSPWPTYDKGAVFISSEDETAGLRAIKSHRYFRYDDRPFLDTECGQFEEKLKSYFGSKHALGLSSGTAAIAVALMAAGIPAGSKVACPGFTFVATPSAIVLAGCKPVLFEVDQNLHLDIDDLRVRWTDDIKAIVVVHMRGFAADMDAICQFADEKGVPVFEDAVPALGAEYKNRKLGTFGLAGAFSTQSDKSLNTGEGGFLLTDDTKLFARAVVLSGAYEGKFRRHFHDCEAPSLLDLSLPLLNFRMDEIRGALAASELDRLPDRLTLFRRNYDYVAERLAQVPGVYIRQPVAAGAYLGEAFIFRVKHGAGPLFAKALCLEGIDARNLGSDEDCNVRTFWNWRFMFDTADVAAIKSQLSKTTRFLEEAVDVPLSSSLTLEDCDHLVEAVKKVADGLSA